tara:strand:+ start:194 stop:397 length:204 start_codon:yes stop_codon:yes gene_type:complete
MHVPLGEKEVVPQLLHVLILDLRELKTNTPTSNKKRGIRINSNKILPIMLKKKLIPNKGTITNRISE